MSLAGRGYCQRLCLTLDGLGVVGSHGAVADIDDGSATEKTTAVAGDIDVLLRPSISGSESGFHQLLAIAGCCRRIDDVGSASSFFFIVGEGAHSII
jgi:hypothetical protein